MHHHDCGNIRIMCIAPVHFRTFKRSYVANHQVTAVQKGMVNQITTTDMRE